MNSFLANLQLTKSTNSKLKNAARKSFAEKAACKNVDEVDTW
jgi:hypothetical protein